MANTLKTDYQKNIRIALKEKLAVANIEEVPKLLKVTVNTSSRDFKTDKEFLAKTKEWLTSITGQVPAITKAKQSIATFNLRENDIVGLKVTLRSERAYDFFQKLVSVVLPKLRDFQGVSRKAFDGQGNYTLGLKEQIVFPEVDYDKIGRIQGLELTISTSAKNQKDAFTLLEALGMPFEKTN